MSVLKNFRTICIQLQDLAPYFGLCLEERRLLTCMSKQAVKDVLLSSKILDFGGFRIYGALTPSEDLYPFATWIR